MHCNILPLRAALRISTHAEKDFHICITYEEPQSGIKRPLLGLFDSWLVLVTSLGADGVEGEGDEKQGQEDQVGPPDQGIAKKVDAMIIAGEKLSLKV